MVPYFQWYASFFILLLRFFLYSHWFYFGIKSKVRTPSQVWQKIFLINDVKYMKKEFSTSYSFLSKSLNSCISKSLNNFLRKFTQVKKSLINSLTNSLSNTLKNNLSNSSINSQWKRIWREIGMVFEHAYLFDRISSVSLLLSLLELIVGSIIYLLSRHLHNTPWCDFIKNNPV